MAEYCRESESLTISYIGVHKCLLKSDTNKYSHQVRDAVFKNSCLGTHGIQQAEVSQVVAASDVKGAHRRAI